MKKITNIFCGLSILTFTAYGQGRIKPLIGVINKFEDFKKKEKFVEDTVIFYPGIADPSMRPILIEKINMAADDFESLAKKGNASDQEYQDKIKIGLQRFANIYINIDTEDRARICHYFEELMDIVGIESSDGLLNNFMYDCIS